MNPVANRQYSENADVEKFNDARQICSDSDGKFVKQLSNDHKSQTTQLKLNNVNL